MMTPQKKCMRSNRQHGLVLIVGLVMLLLMTIIGLSAIRGSNLQELMVGNMRERNQAFQTAEAGLRVAESSIDSLVNNPFNGNGIWSDLNVPGAPRNPVFMWEGDVWETAANSIEVSNTELTEAEDGSTTSTTLYSSKPRYVVERMAIPIGAASEAEGSGVGVGSLSVVPAPDYFRISSRSTGVTGTTDVTLQSTYKTFFVN